MRLSLVGPAPDGAAGPYLLADACPRSRAAALGGRPAGGRPSGPRAETLVDANGAVAEVGFGRPRDLEAHADGTVEGLWHVLDVAVSDQDGSMNR